LGGTNPFECGDEGIEGMRQLIRLSVASAVMAVALFAGSGVGAVPPLHEPTAPTGIGVQPAGQACSFAVDIELVSGDQGRMTTFFDHEGNVTRVMGTARPSVWSITNVGTGVSANVKLPAGHQTVTFLPDGTTHIEISGGVIGFQGPSDTPAGPFAFTNVGRLVVNIAPDNTGTLLALSGHRFDLCAAVA
jgi:hypothetical protein